MNTAYLKDLGEQVTVAFAGALVTALGGDAVDVWHINWKLALGVAGGVAVISLLKGIVAKGFGNKDSASFVK